MPEILSCLEHDVLPIKTSRQLGEQALSEVHAKQLEKLERSLPKQAFSWQRKGIKFSQYCGVIQLGNLTLEILPKTYGKEITPASSRQALINMLKKAKRLTLNKGTNANIQKGKHYLLDVFIQDFHDQVVETIRQGKPREYIAHEENLKVLKGRLLVDQQFKFNAFHKERLFCRYDELSEDTLINQIIKSTLRLLLPKAYSQQVKRSVNELLMRFEGATDKRITLQIIDRLQFNRSNERYRGIIEQCRWFIEGLSPDVVAGNHQGFSLLFDMNKLFENWVVSTLKPEIRRQKLKLKEQGPKQYLAFRDDIQTNVFQMRPDIALLDAKRRVVMIADAKWKLLDAKDKKLGISQQDLYQMQTYASCYGVTELALYYPKQVHFAEAVSLEIRANSSLTLSVIPVDIT